MGSSNQQSISRPLESIFVLSSRLKILEMSLGVITKQFSTTNVLSIYKHNIKVQSLKKLQKNLNASDNPILRDWGASLKKLRQSGWDPYTPPFQFRKRNWKTPQRVISKQYYFLIYKDFLPLYFLIENIISPAFFLPTQRVDLCVSGIKNLIKTMQREQTVTYKPGANNNQGQTPMIRITNRFLIAAGFRVGNKFDVKYANDVITIRKKLQPVQQ